VRRFSPTPLLNQSVQIADVGIECLEAAIHSAERMTGYSATGYSAVTCEQTALS
jgi:hypothetical protein